MLKNCVMWNKLYLGVLGLSIAIMAFFTYYSWSWLQSIGQPIATVEGYNYHSDFGWITLWISSVLLLLLGNVILWLTRHAWAMWTTLLYFAVFVLLRYFWLDEALFHFKKANGLGNGSFSVGPIFAVIIVAVAVAVVFVDQFAVVLLQRKMYPPVVADEPVDRSGVDPASE